MEYLAFAAWCFAIALAGGLVGLVLGNLRLPLAVLLASSPAAGAGANLIISAVAAGSASAAHLRAHRIDWRLFATMVPASVAGALVGGYFSGVVAARLLLAVIAMLLWWSAWQLLRAGHGAVGTPRHPRALAAAGGLVIGLLGGFVGLILGSLRLPLMLRRLAVRAGDAAGTNVLVGLCVGIAGAAGHLPSASPDWGVAAVGAAASLPGALLGSRLTGRLDEAQLVRAIGWVLIAAGAGVAAQALA